LLPVELEVNDKTFGLQYHYLKSSVANDQDRILVVFRDISKEKKLAAHYATEFERTSMIIKVALDIDGYYQYRRSAEALFARLEQELAKTPVSVNLESVLHNIQAIQGGAEIYEINEVVAQAEELLSSLEAKIGSYTPLKPEEAESFAMRVKLLKDRLEMLQKEYLDNLVSDEQILDKAVYRVTKTKISKIRERIIEQVLRKRMEELEGTFEKNYLPFTRLKTLEEITQKRLQRIKEHIRLQVVESGAREITDILSELRKQPIGLMLRRYAIIAVNLGERLKKRVEVEIKGADIEVPFHTLENVFTGLTFVIRNCVEHGLESMEERIALDKSLEGNISIEAALENNLLRISIADDGRGIDVEKIRQAAVKNKVITEAEANRSSEEQILKLMFSKGFSTKKDSSGTFGRGVGLNAVGSAIVELGGDVRVRTGLKKGTTIEVTVPL
jgi:chemotaxis protein histidine kinase CheA